MAYKITENTLTEAIKKAINEVAFGQQSQGNDIDSVFAALEDECPVTQLVAVAQNYESYYKAAVASMANAHKYIMSNQQLQIANVSAKYNDTIVYMFATPLSYNEETDSYGDIDIESFFDDVMAEVNVPQSPYEYGRYLVDFSPEYNRGSDDIIGFTMELNMPMFSRVCEEYGVDLSF